MPFTFLAPQWFRQLPVRYFEPPAFPVRRSFNDYLPENALRQLGLSCEQWNAYDMAAKRGLVQGWQLENLMGGRWSIEAQIQSMDDYCRNFPWTVRAYGGAFSSRFNEVGRDIGGYLRGPGQRFRGAGSVDLSGYTRPVFSFLCP